MNALQSKSSRNIPVVVLLGFIAYYSKERRKGTGRCLSKRVSFLTLVKEFGLQLSDQGDSPRKWGFVRDWMLSESWDKSTVISIFF